MTRRTFISIFVSCCLTLLLPNTVWSDNAFTPIPFTDVNKDLIPMYIGNHSDYFRSRHPMDHASARAVCQNLTTFTGKHFHLLILDSKDKVNELQPHLNSLTDVTGMWNAGEKTFDENGEISYFWVTEDGKYPMIFQDFRSGTLLRKRRDLEKYVEEEENFEISSLNIGNIDLKGGKCLNGKYVPPECEPLKCNVTVPECTTITPDCIIRNQTQCTVQRAPCSAKCENCTVLPPICYVESQPCTVEMEDCQVIQLPAKVTRPPCNTTRNCKTIQPPCESTPPPSICTTVKPCIPTFNKNNCTTITPPCKVNKKNETICPSEITQCQPELKCEPEICQSPPIICSPPMVYCNQTTLCGDPSVIESNPTLYCPEPKVTCQSPAVHCSKPLVNCSAPVINCGEIVTNCEPADIECPPAIVECKQPTIECSTPEPCPTPEPPFPVCPPEPTEAPTTTTKRPCPGCGCVYMSKEHEFQWEIDTCSKEFHFICEGPN